MTGDMAKMNKTIEIAKSIIGETINAKNGKGNTKLHFASMVGRFEDAEILLKLGADVDARGNWQRTPLHLAALLGHLDMAKLLIQHGALANVQDEKQKTPLHQLKSQMSTFLKDSLTQLPMH